MSSWSVVLRDHPSSSLTRCALLTQVGEVPILTTQAQANLPDPRAPLDDKWEGPITDKVSLLRALKIVEMGPGDTSGSSSREAMGSVVLFHSYLVILALSKGCRASRTTPDCTRYGLVYLQGWA